MPDFPLKAVGERAGDRWIRAMLRSATKAKILEGWNGPHTDERSYTVNPSVGEADEWPLSQVTKYCFLLVEFGITPLYRESEPDEAEWVRRRHG